MTLCIAAIASPLGDRIVAVADMLISTGDDSMGSWTPKLRPLSKEYNWLVMFAGDPSVWHDVLRRVKAVVAEGDETTATVQAAFADAFQQELHRKIETEILSPFGMSLPQFLKRGLISLGEHNFTEILTRVQTASLDTDAIVAGFDSETQDASLFSVTDRTVPQHHEHLGFHAIGTGAPLALASLNGTGVLSLDLAESIYRVCEAKFLGERALGVGNNTAVIVLKQGQRPYLMLTDHLEPVKAAWKARNSAPVPKEATNAILDHLHRLNPTAKSDDEL